MPNDSDDQTTRNGWDQLEGHGTPECQDHTCNGTKVKANGGVAFSELSPRLSM